MTIGDRIEEIKAEGKAPDCVSCGNKLENSDVGGAWLTIDYWDCDCGENYIHEKVEMSCKVCGDAELRDGLPDSHVAEVAVQVERPKCRGCQKLPVGLSGLVETAGDTGAAEMDMKKFLLARLSIDDYTEAMRLVHRFRIHNLDLRDGILEHVSGVRIPTEYRIADPEKLIDLTENTFLERLGGRQR